MTNEDVASGRRGGYDPTRTGKHFRFDKEILFMLALDSS